MLKKSLFIAIGLLLVLLSACSLPGSGRALHNTPGPVTTICPPTGTVRAAVAPALALGKHANLIYYDGDNSNPDAGAAVLKRTDVVSNSTIQIARLSNADITEAQVSSDGQWILFTLSIVSPHEHLELRLIRVDGQYQQTLFCLPLLSYSPYSTSVGDFVWSPDGTSVALTGLAGGTYNLPLIYLLDLEQGQVQVELSSAIGPLQKAPAGNTFPQWTDTYFPTKWLDNTHLYVSGIRQLSSSLEPSRRTVYLLDTGKGADQHTADLQTVFSSVLQTAGTGACDFDRSVDGSQLFIANCTSQGQSGLFQAPSTITAQPASGGQAKTLYRAPNLSIDKLEAVGSQTLLFLSTSTPGNGYTGDSLWKINTDGSGLKRLAANGLFIWCGTLQTSCASVARDGSLYALVSLSGSGAATIIYGSLNGGPLKPAATLTSLYEGFVGWTTM